MKDDRIEISAYIIKEKQTLFKIPFTDHVIRINGGVDMIPTFQYDWKIIDGHIETIEKKLPPKVTQSYYILKDELLESDLIPLIISEELIDDYQNIKSLYEFKEEFDSPTWVPVNFHITIHDFLNFAPEAVQAEYDAAGLYSSNHKFVFSRDVKCKSELEQILYPSILYPHVGCKISGENLYKIIRAYVKDNIDPKVASVTSDYEFVFTVCKKIKKHKRAWREDFSAKKKKTDKTFIPDDYNLVSILGILPTDKGNYREKGHRIVPDIEATCHAELKDKIDNLLENIINYINAPVVECRACEGTGALQVTLKDFEEFMPDEKSLEYPG